MLSPPGRHQNRLSHIPRSLQVTTPATSSSPAAISARPTSLRQSPLLRTAVASDDLRRCQRIGTEAAPDLGARGGCVKRQRLDLERVYGDLVVMRVVAGRWARPAVMRKSEVGPPLDCARG